MNDDDPKIGEALKRFREKFNLKQGTVAESIGILQQLYYKYESGRVTPSANIIYRLARAYGVSADYLLGLSDNPLPTDKRLIEAITSCREILNDVLEQHAAK